MAYRIEHIGYCVRSPIEMAQWYERVLGFRILFSAQDTEKAVVFVEDSSGNCVFELGKLPEIEPLCNVMNHPLQFHIALSSDNPHSDADFLVRNGASFIEECPITLPGDQLLLLKDPWGNSIQLAKRTR